MTLFGKFALTLTALTVMAVSGCGGGGSADTNTGTGSGTGTGGTNTVSWVAGQYSPAAQYKDYCATPRTGIDPYTSQRYPDKAGTSMHEKLWLRSWSNDTYLWYRELNDFDPTSYGVLAYFDRLKTHATTDSGAAKDQFHFYEDTADYLQQTQSGVESGYGISWKFDSVTPPRSLLVAYIEPASPAANAGIARGDKLTFVDGVDFIHDDTEAGVRKINAALFPEAAGEAHQLSFTTSNGVSRTANLLSADVATTPVQNVKTVTTSVGKVGYLQFNSHIGLAQDQLIDAVKQFSDENVSELVVDLRYNGGGLLALASQLGYMVSGDNIIQGRFFEKTQFNDKHPTKDPVTGDELTPTPFYGFVIDYDNYRPTNENLPTLALSRVFVLTTDATCSASEAFMNALRGVDVEVIQIGGKTCGKPYGFYPTDNCGTTYFTVQFSGVNAKGFGDYADGFIPTPAPVFDADVKGCPVSDDLFHQLGDVNEAMLKTALHYMQTNECLSSVSAAALSTIRSGNSDNKAAAIGRDTRYRSFILENKINQPIGPSAQKQL